MLRLLDRVVDVREPGSGKQGARRVVVVASQVVDGDVHPRRVDPDTLARRQRATTGTTWSMLDQCHGTDVVDVDDAAVVSSARSDALVDVDAVVDVGDVQRTDAVDVSVAMWAADCATVFLVSDRGRLVAAHAGWRGLADGVLDVAVDALGPGRVVAAVLGPVIHPCCYEFADVDRRSVERGVGAGVGSLQGVTSWETPALDVPRAVAVGLQRRGVALESIGPCTGCTGDWFSHRIRGDAERHATIGWMESVTPRIGPAGR